MDFFRFNLDDLDTQDWRKTWEIYNYSFPEYEKRSLEMQKSAITDDDYFCCGIRKNSNLCGMIFYWRFKEKIYIEHFAIAREFRNLGIGSEVLEYLKSQEGNIIFEVDPQVDEISRRRVRLYKRLEFKENPFDYFHPPLDFKSGPYKLEIMSYPNIISSTDFEDFVEFINEKPMRYMNTF